MMSLPESSDIYKGLTSLAIEKTLLDFGQPTYDKVVDMLKNEYNCYLTDCCGHPEYLSAVLKKLFGSSHVVMVSSITKQLEEFLYKDPIGRFVEIISR